MEKAEAFIREFIEKEFAALKAKYSEPNPLFVPKLQAVNALFSRGVITASGISRTSKADLEKLRPQLDFLTPRTLYRISQYSHPKLGTIYAFYMGEPITSSDKSPSVIYYASETDAGFRVIGIRTRSTEGFIYADGDKDLAKPGKLVATKEW